MSPAAFLLPAASCQAQVCTSTTHRIIMGSGKCIRLGPAATYEAAKMQWSEGLEWSISQNSEIVRSDRPMNQMHFFFLFLFFFLTSDISMTTMILPAPNGRHLRPTLFDIHGLHGFMASWLHGFMASWLHEAPRLNSMRAFLATAEL